MQKCKGLKGAQIVYTVNESRKSVNGRLNASWVNEQKDLLTANLAPFLKDLSSNMTNEMLDFISFAAPANQLSDKQL